jgi:hypothetical protein
VLLSAAHFEWTVSRAIMFLSRTPNVDLREKLRWCTGLDRYRKFWRREVHIDPPALDLRAIVGDWKTFEDAFDLRHGLIHGRDTCTTNTATPSVEEILRATKAVWDFCDSRGVDLSKHMPHRARKRQPKT